MTNLKATVEADGTIEIPVTAGEYIVQLGGTWDGATIAVHWDYDGGTALYTGASFTSDGGGKFINAAGKFAIITTGAGTTSVKVFIAPVINRTQAVR